MFFLNPPRKSSIQLRTVKNNFRVIDYPGHLSGIRFLPSFLSNIFDKRLVSSLQSAIDVKFDVVWSFDNSRFFHLNVFGDDVLKICHIVDHNQNFQTKAHAASADLCLTTSEYILNRIILYNKRVHNIGHGYNFKKKSRDSCTSLPGANKIKALYVGNLLYPTIDYLQLLNIIHTFPRIDFCFIGPIKSSNLGTSTNDLHFHVEQLRNMPNTYLLGPKPADELSDWLDSANILFFVYKESERIQMANPHKMMEYLGSGKPIICSYTHEYRNLPKDLIHMARSNHMLPALFSKVSNDLSYYSSSSVSEARKAVAYNNSYEKQIIRIENLIEETHASEQ